MRLEGMPWHEIILKTGVQTNKHIKKMRDALEVLEKIHDSIDNTHEEVEDYLETLRRNIQIPVWNDFKKVKPNEMKEQALAFMAFSEPDSFFEAIYKDGYFWRYYENEYGKHTWNVVKNVSHWIPILYPAPY